MPVRNRIVDVVAVAERQVQGLALGCSAVTHAGDLERALE
jgi:hypothetical protein